MKKLAIILVLLIGITITSCSKDEFEFQGDWSGIYTGLQDNGTWTMTISENGGIVGKVNSNNISTIFDATGTVSDNGNLSVNIGTTTSGATFQGILNGNTGSGTWNNASAGINGTWSGNRQ